MTTACGDATPPVFRVLGPLSVWTEQGYEPLASSKPAAMLAALLTSPNEIASTDFLVRAVWGDTADVDGRVALRTCTTRLRKLLVRHGLGEDLIQTVSGGYRLRAASEDLDLMLFREQVVDALNREEGCDKIAGLRAALDLWQGSLLCNIDSDVLHRGVVPLVLEERLQVHERVVDLLIQVNRDQEALTELRALCQDYEGHERFAQQLVSVLYRTGRREDALAECTRIKTYLQEELGLDPSGELRQLEVSILNGDDLGVTGPDSITTVSEQDSGATESEVDEVVEPDPVAHRQTARLLHLDRPGLGSRFRASAFVGRSEELEHVLSVIGGPGDNPSLGVICGPPGIGKTAFAAMIALRRDPGGPELLLRMRNGDGTPRPSEAVLGEAVLLLDRIQVDDGSNSALVILDDAEDEGQVADVVAGLSGLSTVVTAGRSLMSLVRSHGAWLHRLRPLSDADALAVLARQIGTERVSGDVLAAHRLLRICWNHPLVLRTAGAFVQARPAWSLVQCVDWLDGGVIEALSSRAMSALSLADYYETALNRLDPPARQAISLLSVVNDMPLDTTTAQGRLGRLFPDALEDLVDRGWLDEIGPHSYRVDEFVLAAERHLSSDAPPHRAPSLAAVSHFPTSQEGA